MKNYTHRNRAQSKALARSAIDGEEAFKTALCNRVERATASMRSFAKLDPKKAGDPWRPSRPFDVAERTADAVLAAKTVSGCLAKLLESGITEIEAREQMRQFVKRAGRMFELAARLMLYLVSYGIAPSEVMNGLRKWLGDNNARRMLPKLAQDTSWYEDAESEVLGAATLVVWCQTAERGVTPTEAVVRVRKCLNSPGKSLAEFQTRLRKEFAGDTGIANATYALLGSSRVAVEIDLTPDERTLIEKDLPAEAARAVLLAVKAPTRSTAGVGGNKSIHLY